MVKLLIKLLQSPSARIGRCEYVARCKCIGQCKCIQFAHRKDCRIPHLHRRPQKDAKLAQCNAIYCIYILHRRPLHKKKCRRCKTGHCLLWYCVFETIIHCV